MHVRRWNRSASSSTCARTRAAATSGSPRSLETTAPQSSSRHPVSCNSAHSWTTSSRTTLRLPWDNRLCCRIVLCLLALTWVRGKSVETRQTASHSRPKTTTSGSSLATLPGPRRGRFLSVVMYNVMRRVHMHACKRKYKFIHEDT